jgi:ATP-dependent Clp protease ATP-binding subunit ClpA
MFERFTKEARTVVVLAQEEARRLCHPSIGTEHLLLAMLSADGGVGALVLREHGLDAADVRRRVVTIVGPPGGRLDEAALATIGIDLDEVRRATEASFGPGALDKGDRRNAMPKGHIPFSKRAKKVLELSVRETLRLGENHIGEGHLLLGLIREGEGVAAQVLVQTGVDLTAMRDEVVRRISTEAA